MASGDGIAMAGVGIGVLLVVFDQTAAGIAFMLLGVSGGVIFGGSSDDKRDRGHTNIPAIVVMAAAFVGLFVVNYLEKNQPVVVDGTLAQYMSPMVVLLILLIVLSLNLITAIVYAKGNYGDES